MNVLLFIWQRRWQWLDFIAASFDEELRRIAKKFDEHLRDYFSSSKPPGTVPTAVLQLQGSNEGSVAGRTRGRGHYHSCVKAESCS